MEGQVTRGAEAMEATGEVMEEAMEVAGEIMEEDMEEQEAMVEAMEVTARDLQRRDMAMAILPTADILEVTVPLMDTTEQSSSRHFMTQ